MAGLTRSFLLGRSMGDAVIQEREETISMLIAHRFAYAPLATRAPSINEFLRLRDDMNKKLLDGTREPLVKIIRKRILSEVLEDLNG